MEKLLTINSEGVQVLKFVNIDIDRRPVFVIPFSSLNAGPVAFVIPCDFAGKIYKVAASICTPALGDIAFNVQRRRLVDTPDTWATIQTDDFVLPLGEVNKSFDVDIDSAVGDSYRVWLPSTITDNVGALSVVLTIKTTVLI